MLAAEGVFNLVENGGEVAVFVGAEIDGEGVEDVIENAREGEHEDFAAGDIDVFFFGGFFDPWADGGAVTLRVVFVEEGEEVEAVVGEKFQGGQVVDV